MHRNFPDEYGSVPDNLLHLPVYSYLKSEFQSLKIPHPLRTDEPVLLL